MRTPDLTILASAHTQEQADKKQPVGIPAPRLRDSSQQCVPSAPDPFLYFRDGADVGMLRQPLSLMENSLPKKTQIVLSLLITFMMALIMSGIMGFISVGPAFLPMWPTTFIIAWPIAFIVTQFVTPLAFKLAFLIAPPAKS
jgi:hypothetical protein